MNLLAIDTSTQSASLALAVNDVIRCTEQPNQRQHAQQILPMIEQLLLAAGLRLSQLDGIVLGQGPGSFTGIRIACSVAQGLAYAHDLPVYPVSSLAAIANDMHSQQTALMSSSGVLVMIDARMNQVYWSCFSPDGKATGESVSYAKDIHLPDDSFPLLVAGVGFEAYLNQLPTSLTTRIVRYQECYPSARAMLRLVLSGQVKAVSAADALPVYVRNQIV